MTYKTSTLGIVIMGKIILSAMLLLALPSSAEAGVCDSKAASVAAREGGRVLSVQDAGKKCRIKILVQKPNQPPKRKTVLVSK